MQDSYDCNTPPADPNVKLTKKLEAHTDEEKEVMSRRPYRSLVGALIYVCCSRAPTAQSQ